MICPRWNIKYFLLLHSWSDWLGWWECCAGDMQLLQHQQHFLDVESVCNAAFSIVQPGCQKCTQSCTGVSVVKNFHALCQQFSSVPLGSGERPHDVLSTGKCLISKQDMGACRSAVPGRGLKSGNLMLPARNCFLNAESLKTVESLLTPQEPTSTLMNLYIGSTTAIKLMQKVCL